MPGVDACVGLLEIPVCCVLKENDQNMSLMVTLFLCWFRFVLLRVFSDDNNSKQKTPQGTLYMAN
jgi:hypothetical protein